MDLAGRALVEAEFSWDGSAGGMPTARRVAYRDEDSVTKTDWSEGTDGRPRWLLLACIVAAGLLLRVFNLGAGIPFAVGNDEPIVMTTVVGILKSGDFNPHFFDYPSGCIYFQLGVAIVTFMLGAMRHSWRTVEHVGPADFYFSARLATAALGAATVAIVHQAGLRWGARTALVAAALLALAPLHVRESHFALTDTPLVFAVALSLLLSLRAWERPTLGRFMLAGAAAGLATGIKYNGLMTILLPLAAAFTLERGRRPSQITAVCVVIGSCVGGFLLTTPFALLDLPSFLNGFAAVFSVYVRRPDAAEASWLVYAKHLRLAFGSPASVLCLVGLVIAADKMRTGPGRPKWAQLLLFPAAFFYVINGWGYIFARYALPLVPFLALWGGIAVVWVGDRLRRVPMPDRLRKSAVAALLVAVLLPPAVGSARWVRDRGAVTTQAQAWNWIRANVWMNSAVVSEARGLDLPLERYRFEYVPTLADRAPEAMAASGVEWVILSSDAWKNGSAAGGARPAPSPAYAPLLSRYREVKVIVPSGAVTGPEIRILMTAGR
jgi:hypothetical protein